MESKTIKFEGKPYCIVEIESGLFKLVSFIEIERDKPANIVLDADSKLELGLNMIEIPNRLCLVCRNPTYSHVIESVFEELRKLGRLIDCDYVSYEGYGLRIANFLCRERGLEISELKPRLFRKYGDN